MSIQPLRSLVRVYVKPKLGQSRNRRAIELTAECDHQPVIAERAQLVRRGISNMNHLIRNIDRSHLAFGAFHGYWLEDIIQRNADGAKVALIVSDTDAVVWIPIDERYCYIVRAQAHLIQLAGGAHGAPKSRKSTAQNDHTFGVHA